MLPTSQPEEKPQQVPEGKPQEAKLIEEKPNRKKLLLLLGLVVAIGVVAYVFFLQKPTSPINVTSTALSTITSQATYISSCINISVPGVYYLQNNIEFNKALPCITVKADDVKILGNGHYIKGNGPYLNVSPFSYGILINSSKNVVISNLSIRNCSYGIFLVDSSKIQISDVKLEHNILSSLALYNSKNVNFSGNISSSTLLGAKFENSSNIIFKGNVYGSGIYDLKCDYSSGIFSSNSLFIGGCINNSGCEFANCRRNYPVNLEVLPEKISGCGIINKPGNYIITKDIYLSNISKFGINCIEVRVGNVSIDLNNKKIVGNKLSTGIKIFSLNEVKIKNGVLQNHNLAIDIFGSSSVYLENVELKENNEGILLNNSNANTFKNLKLLKNALGIQIQNSLGNTFDNFSSYNNTIGFKLEKYSVGNFFERGSAKNLNLDFSCDNSSGRSFLNTFSSSVCSIGNCLWANCTKVLLPYQRSTKINSCKTITEPGNYSLSNNLVTSSSCIQILADNVNLSCLGFSILGNGIGNGIFVVGNNVTITNCKISNFQNSIVAKNLKGLIIDSVKAEKVNLENVQLSSLLNLTATEILANKINKNLIYNTTITNALTLNKSFSNKILFTNVKKLLVLNQSENNSIAVSKFQDVICDPLTVSIEKNNGISSCATKSCGWFVCVSALPSPCQPIKGYLSLFSDYVISAPVCFTVLSNDSTLDCNGHTLFGNSQNTLVFVNASRFTMKNCNVKNFSTVANIYGKAHTFQDINISSSFTSIIGKVSDSIFKNITIFSSPNITVTGTNNVFKNILMK